MTEESWKTYRNGWRKITFDCGHTRMIRKETVYRAQYNGKMKQLRRRCLGCAAESERARAILAAQAAP